ncbi:MAG: hypothetical protein WKG01_39275 [Kofleriaceae bacterium]
MRSVLGLALLLGGCLVTQTQGYLDQPEPGELYDCGVSAGCGDAITWHATQFCGPLRDVDQAAARYEQRAIDDWQLRCPDDFEVRDSVCEGAGRSTPDGIIRVCVYTGD